MALLSISLSASKSGERLAPKLMLRTPTPAAAISGVTPMTFGKSTAAPCSSKSTHRFVIVRDRGSQQRRGARRQQVVR